LRVPVTTALANYLNDLHSTLGLQAYLWRIIVKADYGHGDPAKFPKAGDPAPPESAVAQMDIHGPVLDEMLFCRGVNSFLTYLADLMTLIYEKYPKKLPSNKQATYGFCIEHHMAGDLISALAEETVLGLTHQNFDGLAKYFKKNLDLVLFKEDAGALKAALSVDIRNIITHNRGIVTASSSSATPALPTTSANAWCSAKMRAAKCSPTSDTAPVNSTCGLSRNSASQRSSRCRKKIPAVSKTLPSHASCNRYLVRSCSTMRYSLAPRGDLVPEFVLEPLRDHYLCRRDRR